MPTLKPIDKQVIVITGASSGIGLATAEAAAARGALLVVSARSEETLARLTSRLGAHRTAYVVADVSSREDVERIAATAISRFGGIDTWVNNAGVAIYGRLDEVTDRDNRRLFDINFWGVVNGSLVALEHLKHKGGALINVGSEVSDAVVPLQGMYATSKHAVKGFTDALRLEVEVIDKAPVSITLIQPTAVNTPYPQHARNYMAKEPKLPSPQIEASQVAAAILEAATHPRRDVKVGLMAKLNTALSKILPRVADRLSAKLADKQTYDEPPRNPLGTLFEPGETGRVHGSGPSRRPMSDGSTKPGAPSHP